MPLRRAVTAACLATGIAASLVVATSSWGSSAADRVPSAVSGADADLASAEVASRARPAPWVVTIGDSYISGEGGRWAGNTSSVPASNMATNHNPATAGQPGPVDALGENAYYDGRGHERIQGCHRSESAEVYVGRLRGKNLACSGATTRTHNRNADDGDFKPGIDFYRGDRGVGQLVALRRFARHHRVTEVALQIGGNDFGFASIIATCLEDFTKSSPPGVPDQYCKNDPRVLQHFTPQALKHTTRQIELAVQRTGRAMRAAGYRPRQWTLVVQDYPSPLASGSELRYPENSNDRLTVGGCPFFDKDADAAQTLLLGNINHSVGRAVRHAGLSNTRMLHLRPLFYGSRLCGKGARQIQETTLSSWRDTGAVDQLEWVNQLYLNKPRPWQLQESIHPNYWGQLALRSCLRQAVAGPGTRSGTCRNLGPGLTDRGEPRVALR